MSKLPEDSMMLLSVVNTKLRDCYASLEELCYEMEVNQEQIISKLSEIGYSYNAELNRFV